MADSLRPEGALVFGRENWYFAETLAAPLAPTAVELNAGSTLDFTRMAFSDGTAKPTAEFGRVEAIKRLGDTATYERRGTTKHTGGDIVYSLDPQAAAESLGKKAWETWLDGAKGFLICRYNVPRAISPAAGQFVTVYPADISESVIATVGEGESGEVAGRCAYFITDEPTKLVALV